MGLDEYYKGFVRDLLTLEEARLKMAYAKTRIAQLDIELAGAQEKIEERQRLTDRIKLIVYSFPEHFAEYTK